MTDQLISFETAKLAKEKGFDLLTNTVYTLSCNVFVLLPSDDYPHLKVHRNKEIESYTNGFINWNNLNLDEDERLDMFSGFNEAKENPFSVSCSAPTQSLLQKWLREKHSMHIDITTDYILYKSNKNLCFEVILKKNFIKCMEVGPLETYEEALEQGLYQGLLLIK